MIYNANNYFLHQLLNLSREHGGNIYSYKISEYLKALANFDLVERSIEFSNNKINFSIVPPRPNINFTNCYIDLNDSSLNCEIKIMNSNCASMTYRTGLTYRVAMKNQELYYSIYFYNARKEDLNGIYFYNVSSSGTTYAYYDGEVIANLSKYCDIQLVKADDIMLLNYGFSPDYREIQQNNSNSEFDAARAFNDLISTIDYEKTIELISSANKKRNNVYNLKLKEKK